MRKTLAALVAVATLAGAAVATTSPADAYWRGGWRGGGWGWGGFAAGAALGAAVAAPYYYGYYPYYGYPYPYRPCVWRRWWNGYAWVRACV